SRSSPPRAHLARDPEESARRGAAGLLPRLALHRLLARSAHLPGDRLARSDAGAVAHALAGWRDDLRCRLARRPREASVRDEGMGLPVRSGVLDRGSLRFIG